MLVSCWAAACAGLPYSNQSIPHVTVYIEFVCVCSGKGGDGKEMERERERECVYTQRGEKDGPFT